MWYYNWLRSSCHSVSIFSPASKEAKTNGQYRKYAKCHCLYPRDCRTDNGFFFTETVEEKRKRKKGADGKVGDLLDRVGADYAINDVICIIVRGVVHAGYNLKHIKEEDFRYADGKLTIQLPPIEILDVIVNPTDCDPYMQHGHWSFDEITEIEANAKNKIKDEAIAAHLLEQAAKNGEKQIRALFLGLGYKDIELLQQQQTAQCAIVE